MDSSQSFETLRSTKEAKAARSGRYPNSLQPGGPRFNVPATATTPTALPHRFSNPTAQPSMTNTNDGALPNEQGGVGSSDHTTGDNVPDFDGDIRMGASEESNLVRGGASNNTEQELIHGVTEGVTNVEDSASEESSPKSPIPKARKSATKPKRRTTKSSTAPSRNPATNPKRRTNAKSSTTPSRNPAAPKARTRKAAPVEVNPEEGSASAEIANDSGEQAKEDKAKSSVQALKSKKFATKAYMNDYGLRPTIPVYRLPKANHGPEAAVDTSTELAVDHGEVQDVVRLLDGQIDPQRSTYFCTVEDITVIDKRIAVGFKIVQAKEDDGDDDAEVPPKRSKGPAKEGQLYVYNGLNENLPPMSNLEDIFDDLTENALNNGFREFLQGFGLQKLKVATLCSGTEAPLLAMQMIQDSLKKKGIDHFEIEHQFSCEIEPFKQAYIHRNFKPALLFRDVVELKNVEAHTAFGAPEPVPDKADIMIAGSSCVDYSPLNSNPKEFGTKGESLETLMATLDYAKAHKPTIVILENVMKFPWPTVEGKWREIGYATKVAKLDSKNFYLPQTRTRGYMIGIRKTAYLERGLEFEAKAAVETWFEILEKLQRRASSPFTDFIFADDDVQLQRHNKRAAVLLTTGKNVPWDKCRVECLSYRSCNFLGFKKPVTEWENNGSCKVPEYCNTLWFKRQVERIWDTIDINHLRSIALRSYDMSYKCRCVDLSQSCVRDHNSSPWGIVGCITATANPYLTHRGGPLVGAEALSLQGIPLHKLILNRESSRQQIDLAGNAMTVTTVGATWLAALMAVPRLFVQPSTRQIKPLKSLAVPSKPMTPVGQVPDPLLIRMDLTTDMRCPITVAEIRILASKSIRLCSCESIISRSSQGFQQCLSCGHTSCVICGEKPTHHYHLIELGGTRKRTPAIEFEERIRQALPPRLVISGLSSAYAAAASTYCPQLEKDYIDAVKAVAGTECRLISIKRDRGWSVVYESQFSRFVLNCQRKWDGRVLSSENFDDLASIMTVQWSVYAKPNPKLPANSQIRKELLHPIARLTCSESLFDGDWGLRMPAQESFTLEVVGKGEKVDSWEKRQGIQEPLFKDRLVWPILHFREPEMPRGSDTKVPSQILGRYDLLQDCGTACGSLHVKQKTPDIKAEEPMFFFLDPAMMGNASNDSFVFANQHNKLGLKEVREVVAKVDSHWRPTDTDEILSVTCEVPAQWVPVDHVQLAEYAVNELQDIHLASADAAMRIITAHCGTSSLPMIWSKFHMTEELAQELGVNRTQKCFKLVKNPFSLEPLSWLIKTAGQALNFTKWQHLPTTDALLNRCLNCAPQPPSVMWKGVLCKKKYQIRPFENTKEASEYERHVKAAPEAVTAELSFDQQSALAQLKIDFNILTLVHKAIAALSESHPQFSEHPKIQWRAVVDHGHSYDIAFPQIELKDCQHLDKASQPPTFGKLEAKSPTSNECEAQSSSSDEPDALGESHTKRKKKQELKDVQLKSLNWMIRREEDDDESWDEQEVVEAFAAPMSLRLEAKVTVHHQVKGGVLADDVGYGKTALVLGLVDTQFQKKVQPVSSPAFTEGVDNMISSKATLILVPSNLIDQWEGEIKKFLGTKTYKIVILKKENFAKESRVSHLQKADIVLASWGLFDDSYFTELARMSRAHHTPVSAGRGFEEWFQMALEDLKTLVRESHGLQPERLNSAWNGLKRDKYERFLKLSKRNKKGNQTPDDAENEHPSKKAKVVELDFDDVEIEVPTKPFLPLHGCFFERIVVDEFTYIDAKRLPAVLALQAPHRWILSGTPPHNTFDGVNTMAKLLGTTVGLDDGAELRYQNVKDKTTLEFSGGEVLRSYATSHSPSWHGQRNEKAKEFVDKFVRKNTAIVKGVGKHSHYQKVVLTALERALYLEVFLVLVNQGARFGKKDPATKNLQEPTGQPTRTEQLVEHITSSQLPEDALITLCSTMPAFAVEPESEMPCRRIITEKETIIAGRVANLLSDLQGAFWMIQHYKDAIETVPEIHNYLRSVQDNRFGDTTVRALLDLVIAQAKETKKWTVAKGIGELKKNASKARKIQYAMRSNPLIEADDLSLEGRQADLKTRADWLTSGTIVLTEVVRERRFFLGTKSCMSKEEIKCSRCGCQTREHSKMLLMGRCGHAGCKECFFGNIKQDNLYDHCLDEGCGSTTLPSSTIEASDLTTPMKTRLVREHGSKMAAIINLLGKIPKGEKVLIFAQFPRIIAALKSVLEAQDIPFADTTVPKEEEKAAAAVKLFTNPKKNCNVCVLQLDSVNAAGWNLQAANHVFLVSSLVAKTGHEYKSSKTQAVGRVLRMGQKKDVHVYHFLAEKTIDVNILQDQEGRELVERGGEVILVEERKEGDCAGFGGLPFRGGACAVGGDDGEEEGEEGEEEE